MKTNRRLSGFLASWCIFLSAIFILGEARTASAFDSNTRALCYQCWKNAFYWVNSDGRAYFRNQQGGANPVSFWHGAELIELTEDAVSAGLESPATVNALCS